MLEKSQLYFFFGFLGLIGALGFFIALPYLEAVVLAGAFAVVFYHPYKKLLKLVRFEGIAAVIIILLVALVIFVPLTFVGFQVVREATSLYGHVSSGELQQSFQTFQNNPMVAKLMSRIPTQGLPQPQDIAKNILNWLIGSVGTVFSGTISLFLNGLICLFALFYFLKDGARLREWIIAFTPLPTRYDKMILERLTSTVNSVVRGYLVIALLQGLSVGLALTIFHVPNPALWASIAAISALIPAVSTTTVFVPTIAYLFLQNHPGAAIGIWIWWLVSIFFIDNVLSPRLVNRGARIHPFVIFIAVLGGITFFGPVGFLIGPLVFSLLFALLEIYISFHKEETSKVKGK